LIKIVTLFYFFTVTLAAQTNLEPAVEVIKKFHEHWIQGNFHEMYQLVYLEDRSISYETFMGMIKKIQKKFVKIVDISKVRQTKSEKVNAMITMEFESRSSDQENKLLYLRTELKKNKKGEWKFLRSFTLQKEVAELDGDPQFEGRVVQYCESLVSGDFEQIASFWDLKEEADLEKLRAGLQLWMTALPEKFLRFNNLGYLGKNIFRTHCHFQAPKNPKSKNNKITLYVFWKKNENSNQWMVMRTTDRFKQGETP
jgi:hypothetical protein